MNDAKNKMIEVKNPIKEAERYLNNAKTLLSEKGEKEGKYYGDSKYVRMAGDTAWKGVLIALDAVLGVQENLKKGQRADIKDYKMAMAKKDNKMSKPLHSAYESLHLYLGYDGNPRYELVQSSLKQGKELIDWASNHYNQN